MWTSAPQALASSPDAGPAKSASQILFGELGTPWGLSSGSGQVTHRETLSSDLGPLERRNFRNLDFPCPVLPIPA